MAEEEASVFEKVTSTVSDIWNSVKSAGSGIAGDLSKGIEKLTTSESDWNKLVENDADYKSWQDRTNITSKINNAVMAGDSTGLTEDELVRYNNMVKTSNSGGGSSDNSGTVEGGDSTTETAEPELTYAEQILVWAEESGQLKSIQDMKDIIADPNKWMADNGLNVKDAIPDLDADADGTIIDGTKGIYNLEPLEVDPTSVVTLNDLEKVDEVNTPTGETYTAATNTLTEDEMAVGVTGEVTDDMLVNAPQIDMEGAATGVNADGSINQTGVALNDYAYQDTTNMIDLSTTSGQELARQLGEGNYTDKRSSYLGQLEIISRQFVNEKGETVIPPWAKSLANSVAATMAYDGITGSAQTTAMATAIMEAAMTVADKEATFFQDIYKVNLSNKQQMTINKATVLAQFDVANLDARSKAAVQNAQAFLDMEITNLTNEQQAEIVNKQARVQTLFENTQAVNAERLFTAETKNDMTKFYSELNVAIQRHNTSEINALKKFNAGETNDASQFMASIRDGRDQFYATMQFNIDTAVTRWRQDVVKTEFLTEWDAITTDTKNTLDLTTETMTRLWDTTDSTLDMIWKMADGDSMKALKLMELEIMAQQGQKKGSSLLGGLIQLGAAFLGAPSGAAAFATAIGLGTS